MTTGSDFEKEAILRVKLDNLSTALKKLANVFNTLEAENAFFSLTEPQMVNRLISVANQLKSFKSLEDENEGELFIAILKNIYNVIQSVGILKERQSKLSWEEARKIVKAFKALEESVKDLFPVIASIDEERGERNFEPFGGLLQKVIDTIQERGHLIMKVD